MSGYLSDDLGDDDQETEIELTEKYVDDPPDRGLDYENLAAGDPHSDPDTADEPSETAAIHITDSP